MSEQVGLTRKEASAYLTSVGCALSPKSLANLAANNNAKGGPPFTRLGVKTVRYHRSDLRSWANETARRVL